MTFRLQAFVSTVPSIQECMATSRPNIWRKRPPRKAVLRVGKSDISKAVMLQVCQDGEMEWE